MKYTIAVTNRNETDILIQSDKAFYNVSDWERLYNNTEYVKTIMEILLHIGIVFNSVTPPTITKIPTVTDFNTLIANINRIRVDSKLPAIEGLVTLKDDWAAGSKETTPTYIDVNAWEKVVDIMMQSIGVLVEYNIYCGVATAGMSSMYQHRWREYQWVRAIENPIRLARTNVAICGAGLKRNNGYRRYA